MAQKFVVIERRNPLKPKEPAKFYAMARSNRRVDTDEIIGRVSERSSYSIGELKGCITEFLLEMKNQLMLGNIVLLGDMGSFRITLVTGNATETAEKFKAATCIKKSRVRFHPGSMLTDMCKAMKYTLWKTEKDGEEGGNATPPDGGNTGGDGGGNGNPDNGNGEAPDPSL
ncbi:HU family DNA-binding protein [uncultured Bacteroides sp.]|jgi:DNA-binding protein, histone-like, putative|uniref:HU family DNA-binding protein n=1 Tax=uncultured Bacteroides sp. TaxID=162156 RepID=UPI0026770E23|nr:HU family DNA-binding protein [uncultured Bacteroides sp.]